MQNIITPAQARELRTLAQLSQSTVAREAGLKNRSYLSLFEAGRYVLPDGELKKLRLYLESKTVEPPSGDAALSRTPGDNSTRSAMGAPRQAAEASMLAPAAPSIDGFQHAGALSPEDAEALAEEFHADEDELQALLAAKHEEPFFSETSKGEDRVSKLLLKKALLVRLLRGEVPPTQTERGAMTLGAALLERHGITVPENLSARARSTR